MKAKPMVKVMGLLLCLVLVTSQTFAISPAPFDDDYAELTVLNPTSAVEADGEYAPRLDDLNGKRVAMWLTDKALNVGYGEIVYEQLAEKLKAEYPDVVIIPYDELPIKYSPRDEVMEGLLGADPDAVIVGVGG
jgi:hypothetical protein